MTALSHPPLPRSRELRRLWLEDLYTRFHDPQYIGTDPLVVLYRYENPADREIVGLIAALLAYGNVKAIMQGIENVLRRLGASPYDYITHSSPTAIARDLRGFRYRVTSEAQMTALITGVKFAVAEYGSLNAAFIGVPRPAQALRSRPCVLAHDSGTRPTRGLAGRGTQHLDQLAGFVDALTAGCGGDADALLHLVPHPSRGSACKRLMLYLRWMVRRDAIDPGGWIGLSTVELIIPLDTHVHRMSRRLGLTRRKQANLVTAMEITARLRQFCADDPLRYDFCLTRPGIMRVVES